MFSLCLFAIWVEKERLDIIKPVPTIFLEDNEENENSKGMIEIDQGNLETAENKINVRKKQMNYDFIVNYFQLN